MVNNEIAQYYNGNELIINNIDEFCNWAFTGKHNNYKCIAHYGQGYDAQFITSWLLSHSIKPVIIPNGNKIMILEVNQGYQIRLIDSILFTLIPLRHLAYMNCIKVIFHTN